MDNHLFGGITFSIPNMHKAFVGSNRLRYSYITASKEITLSSVFSGLLLLDDGQLDAISLRKRDHGFSSLTNHEHIGETSGELMSSSISHMDNIEGTEVAITTNNHTHTSSVVSLCDETQITSFELHMTHNLVRSQINLHRIVHLHHRIRITNSASIMSHNERNLLRRQLTLHNFAQLELHIITLNHTHSSLLLVNAVENETTLHIIQQTEAIARTFQSHNIYSLNNTTHTLPMKPAGKVESVRTFPSTFTRRCMQIIFTS